MVGVAERLRRQVVALETEGSNPSVHPNSPRRNCLLVAGVQPALPQRYWTERQTSDSLQYIGCKQRAFFRNRTEPRTLAAARRIGRATGCDVHRR